VGSAGNRRNIGGPVVIGGVARRRASGDLIAKMIDVPPWDSPAGPRGVPGTSTSPILSSSGVTVVLPRLALALRVFSSF
jgi:hypothetical protein